MKLNDRSNSLAIGLAVLIVLLGAKAGLVINDGLNEISTRHTPTLTTLQQMESNAFESIQEAYAYTVLNDEKEKNEFYASMREFDEAAEAFQAIAGSQEEEVAQELAAFNDLLATKAEVGTAAEAMFEDFERFGVTRSQSAGAFETSVDEITLAFEQLVEVERLELDEHAENLDRTVLWKMGLLLLLSMLLLIVLVKNPKKTS